MSASYNKPSIPKGYSSKFRYRPMFCVDYQLLDYSAARARCGLSASLSALLWVYYGAFRYIMVYFSANFKQIDYGKILA